MTDHQICSDKSWVYYNWNLQFWTKFIKDDSLSFIPDIATVAEPGEQQRVFPDQFLVF